MNSEYFPEWVRGRMRRFPKSIRPNGGIVGLMGINITIIAAAVATRVI